MNRELLIAKDVAYAAKGGTAATFTADTTNGLPTLTNVSSIANLAVGDVISGTGIPAGAFIVSIDSATQITINANASATGTGVTITEDSVISNIRQIDRLASGAVALFYEDGSLVNIASPSFGTTRYFTIAVGDQVNGVTKISQPIHRTGRFVLSQYTAVVKEVQFIGNDGATGALNNPTLAAGQRAAFYIYNNSRVSIDLQKPRRYEYVVKTGDTMANVLAGLVAAVNADTTDFKVIDTIAIVGSNVGLQITFKEGIKGQIGVDGILSNATIIKDGVSNSVKPAFGNGTPAYIAELENELSTVDGNTSRFYWATQLFKQQPVAANLNYDMFAIEWTPERTNLHTQNKGIHHDLILAVPDGASTLNVTNLNATLVAAFS